jgi:hypothetical protein
MVLVLRSTSDGAGGKPTNYGFHDLRVLSFREKFHTQSQHKPWNEMVQMDGFSCPRAP